MEKILYDIAEILIIFISGMITKYLIPWLKAKTNVSKMGEVLAWVEQYVKAAEVLIPEKASGEQKLDYVTELLYAKCKKIKYNVTEEDIRGLIEAAVLEIKE